MAPPPLELDLPDRLDEATLLRALADRFELDVGRARTADRVLLDTFDARLRAAGLQAEWAASPTASRRSLTLREPGRSDRRADVPDGPAVGAAALPPGPLRQRLAPILEERALLPLAEVRSRTLAVAVLNGDGKTVVRLTLERAVVGHTALPPRLVVEAVRGYERDFDRTIGELQAGLGLVRAGEPLFDAAVTAAGGRPEGVSSKVRVALEPGLRADVAAGAVLAPLADIAVVNVPGVLDDLDPEFLHDLRVAIRRARSVLRELADVHPPRPRARLRTELRWAQALTGPVRDLDVQLGEWDELSGSSAAELEPLRQLLVRRRVRELTVLRRGLRSRRFAAMIEAWRALAGAPSAASPTGSASASAAASATTAATADDDRPRAGLAIEVVAADRVRRVYDRMVRDGRRIDDDSPDEALHELRKRGKELRYLLELFGSLYPSAVVRPMVGALKDLQDVLGRFQDRSVQAESLRDTVPELVTRPGGPDAVLATGQVIARLEADQRRARNGFAQRFEAFSSKEQRTLVRDTFGKVESV